MPETILGKVSVTPKGAYDAGTQYERLDAVSHGGGSWMALFLSTLPARGATVVRFPARCGDGISIHAPRKRSDGKIQQTSKMDFAQKSQIKISNTQNRIQFCVSSTILT